MTRAVLGAILIATVAVAQAQVAARAAWVRATVQGQATAGAYMRLSSSEHASLVGAESPVAESIELHETRMEGKVMRMRELSRLELAPGKTVELKPGGYHMMLIGLKRRLKEGEVVPIRLKLEMKDGSERMLEVKAEVRGGASAEHRVH